MIIDDENATTNYNRYHARDISKTVKELSPERKQKLLDEIQLHKGINNLTNHPYDSQTCAYIEKLLSKETTK